MPINFPTSPTLNQVFTSGDYTYIWDGSSWVSQGSPTGALIVYNVAEAAQNTANAAFIQANAAFNAANNALDTWVRGQANAAFDAANTADAKAVTAGSYANSAFIVSNTAAIAANTPSHVANSAAIYANGAFDVANTAAIAADTPSHVANSASIYANGAFDVANTAAIAANTPSHVANSAAIYANGAFVVANNEAGVNATQNNSIAASFTAANSAGVYANGAFAVANNEAGVNATQNNSITASFEAANSAGVYANGAFTRANNSLNANTGGTITGDLSITGNLSVLGNTFSISATTLIANDTLLILGANNYYSDILDIGFAAHYNDTSNAHTGLIRDSGSKEWQLFEGYTPEIGANNQIDINDPSFKIATLNANVHATKILVKGIDLLPYVNNSFDASNTADAKAVTSGSYANSAFLAANTADSKAVSAGSYANSAFATANNEAGVNATQNTTIQFAWNHANSAYNQANNGGASVSVGDDPPAAPTANSLWWQSNTGELKIYYNDGTGSQWVDAFSSAYSLDQWARDQANAAFNQANTGGGASVSVGDSPPGSPTANSLWWQSNTATLKIYYDDGTSSQWVDASPSAYALDQSARDTANAAFIHANAAFNAANTGGGADQYARNTANAAFIRANNSIDANNGGTITGNLVIGGNVVPTTDNTYYLGAQSNRWHSLYVGPGSVDIDNVKISNTGTTLTITGTSDLVVGGLPSLQNISTQANTDVTGISVTGGTYGNATYYPVVTVAANGRIESISTSASGGGGGGGVDTYARNHANSAYGQANTATTAAATAQATADAIVSKSGFVGRYNLTRTAYQNIGNAWNHDWAGSLTAGTFCRMPLGGGHNETDTPSQWVVNKRGERFTGGFGQTTFPYYSDDPRVFYKKYYGSSRGFWGQREEIYRSESVTESNVEMIGQLQLVHGNNAANWLDPNQYFNGPTPNTTNTLATQGSYLDSGTTSSVTLSAGEKLYFNINGQRARLTYTTASGWTSGNIDVDDYGGNLTEIYNDQGTTQTFYYSYFAQGQDTERTFVKVFKRIENSSFSTTSARDKGLNLWNYYWRNDEFGSTNSGMSNGIIAPTSSIYFSSQRLHRIWFAGPSKTLPTNSRPYSIAVKLHIENPLAAVSNLWQAGDAVNTTNAGMIFTLNTASTGERRVNCTMYSAAAALVTNLKVWQFAGDTGEDVNFHWSWNPLDTVYPGRLYVNNKLVFCTATNPLASGLGFFGVGSMSSGTANGFQGYLNLMTIMPEAWGNHIPQGSYALDWDSTTGLASTTNNGTVSVDAAARTAIPRKAYIRSSSTFVQGAYFNMENGAPYSTSGSYTASCVTTADSRDVTFSNSVGGWINPSGVYLVTGVNIRTTRNVYTSLTFGDKGFGMDAMDDLNTATASGTTTLTFTRINGGHYDAWYTTGASITQPGNSTSLSKTNNSAQTLTNCIAGVNSTTYLAFGAFPNITFTAVAGSSGDDTLAGSPYIRTNTSSDAAARNIQGMLGVGKKPSITGAGIPTVSATVDHTYVDDVYWDHYGRAAHLIILSQAKTGNATASTYTCVYVPGNRSSFDGGLDDTGGDSSIIDSYDYSTPVARTGDTINLPPNDQELEYGLGILKSMRVTPPRGFYDSGIFKATASGFFRRMYVGYGNITALVNYGSSPDLNRSASLPSISYPATAATANGLTVSVSAGTYYRVVVIPLSSIISIG